MKLSFPRLNCLCLGLAAALLGASAVRAQTVTLDFSAGRLFDSSGTLLPNGTLAILVADTLQNGFGTLQAGTLNVGDYLNGDNQILARGTINNGFFGLGTAGGSSDELTLQAGSFPQLSTNDPLAVIWFNGLTAGSFSVSAGTAYGTFTGSSWLVPAEGSTESFQFFTASRGGSYDDILGRANLFVTAIPEPSTYATLAGALALALACYRRRNLS